MSKTTEQIIADGAEARDLARMMHMIIIELHGEKILEKYMAGDELPAWVTERVRRVRSK